MTATQRTLAQRAIQQSEAIIRELEAKLNNPRCRARKQWLKAIELQRESIAVCQRLLGETE